MRIPSNGPLLPLLIATALFVVAEANRKRKSETNSWAYRTGQPTKNVPSNALRSDHSNAFRRQSNLRKQRGYRLSAGNEWSSWRPYGQHSESRGDVTRSQRSWSGGEGPKVASHEIRPEDRMNAKRRGKNGRTEKPNIVVILTDDQDSELGSMAVMKKTLRHMRDGGVTFKNSFVSTPMCCPSRSSFLTGMYVHNHNVYTNNDNCSSPMWREKHETRNFGAYLSNAGYRTGYFGKYLNEYDGKHIPPGWREWVGLVRNSRFYNYSVNFNGEIIRHGFDYSKDYFTDLIANDSVAFLRQSKQYFPKKPIAMVLSVPAPHGPEDSAPQYQDLFGNNTSHHTRSWNHAPNPDHQWILANTGKMEPIHIAFTNMLHQKRLQTLMSVDDLVNKVFTELSTLKELENTYVIYTSDHGYHLGQFGLLKGKAMPYDFDVRVPLLVRGPGLQEGVTIENLVQNVDIAPTLLDMAGIPVPPHMDGRSFLPLLQMAKDRNNIQNGKVKKKKAWRDTVLLERGKLTRRNIKTREKLERTQQNRITKEQAMVDKCKLPENASPCRRGQKWECRENERGRLRMYKCRLHTLCRCLDGRFGRKPRDVIRAQRLKKRQNKGSRGKRSVEDERDDSINALDDEGSGELDNLVPSPGEGSGELDNLVPSHDTNMGDSARTRRCRVLANDTVVCDEDVYNNVVDWKRQKAEVNKIIQNYRLRLEELRDMRRHLRNKKPSRPLTTYMVTTQSPSTTTRTTPAPVHQNPDGGYVPDYDPECVCDAASATTPAPAPEPEVEEEEEESQEVEETEEDENRMKLRLRRLTKRYKDHPSTKIQQKMEMITRRLKKKKQRARRARTDDAITKKCNKSRMKCFVHDNDHWKTKPVWTSPRRDPACTIKGVECHRMDNAHWKTQPKWTLGPFCFCPNSANNTYWCLRTINDTHNFLYCEFITGFMSYYDMVQDPWQLRNAIHDLHFTTVHELHDRLDKMKRCKGSKECTHRTRGGMEVPDLPNETTKPGDTSVAMPTEEVAKATDVGNALLEGSGEVAEGSGEADNTGSSNEGSGEDSNETETTLVSNEKETILVSNEEALVVEYGGSGEGSGDVPFLESDGKQNLDLNTNFSYKKEQSDVI